MIKPNPPQSFTHRGVSRESTKLDRHLSRARIETDLSTFEKAGGKIEKLGNTQRLKHIP